MSVDKGKIGMNKPTPINGPNKAIHKISTMHENSGKGLDHTLLGFKPLNIIENGIESDTSKNQDLYSSYGKMNNNVLIHANTKLENEELTNTLNQANLQKELKYGETYRKRITQHYEYGGVEHNPAVLKKRSSTNRESVSPAQLPTHVAASTHKSSAKSTRPPKAPRKNKGQSPQNLGSKFDQDEGTKARNQGIDNAVTKSSTNNDKPVAHKNAEISSLQKKAKKLSKQQDKHIKSQPHFRKGSKKRTKNRKLIVAEKKNGEARRHTAKVLDPLYVGSMSEEDSEEESRTTEEATHHVDFSNKQINSFEDFINIFGCEIINETTSEIHIKSKHPEDVLKIPKHIFNEFCTRCSVSEEIALKHPNFPEVGSSKTVNKRKLSSENVEPKTPLQQINNVLVSNLEYDNLRVGGELDTERKESSRVLSKREDPPPVEKKPDAFEDVFKKLAQMSNADTLFDDFDDDDDEAPPPTRDPKNLVRTDLITSQETKKASQQSLANEESKVFDSPATEKRSANSKNRSKYIKMEHAETEDPHAIIAMLKEEVRRRDEELEHIKLSLKTVSNNPYNPYGNLLEENQEVSIHLAFLFSSPLVRKINTNLEMIMQLDYLNEVKNIEKQLKNVRHEIRYKVDVATQHNFRSVVQDGPFALHFTGHGIQNDKNALGNMYNQYKDKGDILLLEDENGMAEYLFENDLIRLVQIIKNQKGYSQSYEVVFVSSCYSEFAGKIFLSSGARHVICIDKDERISDKASLRFSQVFYEALFVK